MEFDVAIAGGGLAGSAAGILLHRKGLRVAILEKNAEASAKVCGEFLSPAVWPVFEALDLAEEIRGLGGKEIRKVSLTCGSRHAEFFIPAGYSLSRKTLDGFLLCRADQEGCSVFRQHEVRRISKSGLEAFDHGTRRKILFEAQTVLNATGKLHRGCPVQSIEDSSRGKIGFKAHFDGPALNDNLRLNFFDGGYFGLVEVENGAINLCGIVEKKAFKEYGADFDRLLHGTAKKNGRFHDWYMESKRTSDWLSCSPLIHGKRNLTHNGIFHAGDAACFTEPFMGQGMTMAFVSAFLFASGAFEDYDARLDAFYKKRLNWGNFLDRFAFRQWTASAAIVFFQLFPFLWERAVQETCDFPLPLMEKIHVPV